LFCHKTFSRPLGKLQRELEKILPINSINTAFTTVAQKPHQGVPKSGVHRFRAPFLCSFLLEKQKKIQGCEKVSAKATARCVAKMNSSLRSSNSIFANHSAHLALRRNLFKAVRKTEKQ
jgi:hypothetical protein